MIGLIVKLALKTDKYNLDLIGIIGRLERVLDVSINYSRMDEALKGGSKPIQKASNTIEKGATTAQLSIIREKTFLLYIFFGKWDPYISTKEIYSIALKAMHV